MALVDQALSDVFQWS